MKFDYNQVSGFGEEVIGNLDRQMTKIVCLISSPEPFGSGELKALKYN